MTQNNNLSRIITTKNLKTKILQKGKDWNYNLFLGNPYYSDHIIDNDVTELINFLKTKSKVYAVQTIAYGSNTNTVDAITTYMNYDIFTVFTKNNDNITKLVTLNSKTPIEHVKLGYNNNNDCIVPLLISKTEDDKFIGINI